MPAPVNLHCGFLYPKKDFKLIFLNTIGYISDNTFYRLNMQTFQTEIVQHQEGRSYQAFTANHKRQMVVLVEYGKNPVFSFQYRDQNKQSFQIRDVCELQVIKVQLSLDGKYLAVVCGVPEPKIVIIDIENRKLLPGTLNFINLEQNLNDLKRIQFNPANSKQLAVSFSKSIQIYEIKQCFELNSSQQIEEAISIRKTQTVTDDCIELFIWDQINNLYISNKKEVYIFSTDTNSKVLSCDIQLDLDQDQDIVKNIILTKKHILVFYRNGRIQWLNKYYPDLMQEEEISMRPFYLDKYYEMGKEVITSSYDGQFTKIFITFKEGCFGILNKAAESNQPDEDYEQAQKKQDKVGTEKKINVQMVFSHHYHSSPIVLVHEYPNTSVCMTLSTVGRLIFWSIKNKKQIETHSIQGDISCASINKTGNVLTTGHSNGTIRFYSIAKPDDIFLFRQLKMIKNGSIDQVCFSSNGQQLAVLSKSQNRVFYILTNVSMEFEILGYVTLPQQARHIAWIGDTKSPIAAKFQYLLVASGSSFLMINGPVAVPTKKRGKQLELNCDIYASRTDPDQNLVCGLPTGEIITTGKDLFFKKYKQPEDLYQKIDFKSKLPPAAPLDQIDAHDFQTLIFKHSERYLLSGGKQGTVQIRQYNKIKQFNEIRAFGWKNQNISCISGSWMQGVIYVAGRDGSFYVWTLGDSQIKGQQTVNLTVPNFKHIQPQQNIKYYEVIIEEEYLQRMKETISQKKKTQFQKLQKIRADLKHLLQQNQKHQELERLTRDQFAIDLETRDQLDKEGAQKCKKIVEESKRKILYSEVYAKRLKQITWDRMEEHLSAINGLKNRYIVYNYQLRKIPAIQKRRIKLILQLRKSQKFHQKKASMKNIDFQDLKNKNIVNGGVPTPLIMTQIQAKKEDKKDDKKKKKQQQAQVQVESVEQLPAEEEWQLLYSSFELFNNNAKRNQIIMMKNVINLAKKSFNKEFNKLAKLRQNQNELIKDKNKRIIEICEQLKRQNDTVLSKDNILENNDGVLKVSNDEIPFERYLSREERQKNQKERLKEEERLRKLAEDDSAQRALQKMMGGTLEEKKVSALEFTVEKQKWMDKPIEDMNEEQKVKLKEYEQKRQKAEQQKQRLVKKLEAELRKLKQQIDEAMQKYDQKLFQLLKKRIEYDYRIEEQQLYCARLSLSMLNQQQEEKRHKVLKQQVQVTQKRLDVLSRNKQQLQIHQSQFQNQRDTKRQTLQKERLGEFQSKIKTIEKSVFEEYHTNIKKRRQMSEKLLETNPSYKHQIINMDPMKEIQSKNLSTQIGKDFSFFVNEIKTLQRTFQIPENTIQRLLENRFNLRKQEHDLEQKQKILMESVKNMEANLNQTQNAVARQEEQIVLIEQFLVKCKNDLDIQIRIKQGQVEVNNEKPVPDLDDALLISKSEIDQKNIKIKKEANQKISVMKQIKTCKIKVTEESLNLQKKQQHIDKLTSMIKEIQMLKVKKQMQLALSKKDTKINENQLKSLKEQIEKVRKEGQKRIALYQDKIKKIHKQIDTIKKQNKQLETQKWNLEITVKQREKIKDMMCGDGQSGQQAAEKFDQISVNRKLFDKAKQQTEQIQLLREQLSKLKAKTFANFSNVQR